MNINGFKIELEERLLIEKQNLIQELSLINNFRERLEVLGKFHTKYRELITIIADENNINLKAPYKIENNPFVSDSNLSCEQLILVKTKNIYDSLVGELYEEIKNLH